MAKSKQARIQLIEAFVNRLGQYGQRPGVYNPYHFSNPANAVRRANLIHYLNQVADAPLVLIGEAPGYRGCRWTGIPFSSEYMLFSEKCLGEGYEVAPDAAGDRKEPTAGMIWKYLQAQSLLPLCWNAFPFHPYPAYRPTKNRKPNAEELKRGAQILKEFIVLFPDKPLVAVGGVAASALDKMGFEHLKVRHPSYGGKADFVRGMDQILAELRAAGNLS